MSAVASAPSTRWQHLGGVCWGNCSDPELWQAQEQDSDGYHDSHVRAVLGFHSCSPSMRVCTLRAQLEEHMVGMSKLEKGRVQYITTAGKLLCLRGSASVASLLKQQDEP